MPDNLFASVNDTFNHIDNDGLLVGNNAEWAKEAVVKSTYVSLDYYVPCQVIEDTKKHCREQLDYYSKSGSIAQVECYTHFINLLDAMWQYPDVSSEVKKNVLEQKEIC